MKWIKTSDVWPSDGEWVIARDEFMPGWGDEFFIAQVDGRRFMPASTGVCCNHPMINPTHWMPLNLPRVPEEIG